jgi:hypothetical protein
MDRISDMFAFGGGRRGSGCKSPPPPARSRQQGQDDFSYNGGFSFNSGVGRGSDRGVPTRTIQWDLAGGTGGNGDEEPGGGDPFTLCRGSGAGQPVATACTQQGDTAGGNAPPGLRGHGDPPPVQGGWITFQGHHRRRGPPLRGTLGWGLPLQNRGRGTQELQNHELTWQKAIDRDTSKVKVFQETAGGLQEFKTYLFIKKGSTYCTVLHSPMNFMAISKATQHLQGQFIGFVEDCTVTWEPTPILFPLQKTWQWVKEEVCTTGPDLLKYNQEDASHRGKLWSPGEGARTEEMNVLWLLLIPLVLFEKIRAEGYPLMPHEVLKLVIAHLKNVTNDVVVAAWSLIANWCLMAVQRDSHGDSWVAFSVEAITEGVDKDLSWWLEQSLSSTLDTHPAIGPPAGGTGAHAQRLPTVSVICRL